MPQKFIIKARALQDDTELTLGLLVMRENNCLCTALTLRENLLTRIEVVRTYAIARGTQLVKAQLEPQLSDLVLDDEQHLVMVGWASEWVLRA